jgi:hypothetical protein
MERLVFGSGSVIASSFLQEYSVIAIKKEPIKMVFTILFITNQS